MSLVALSVLTAMVAETGTKPTLKVDYANFQGLTLNLDEVPVVTGSSFQYYERGWTKGHYSSAWKPIEKEVLGDGRIQVRFNGADGQVAGTHLYTPRPDGFDAEYHFRWRGNKPVMLEASFARLWAPLFAQGSLKVDGFDVGPLNSPVKAGSSFEQRAFNQPSATIEFSAPFGDVTVESSRPLQVMDARNYGIEWAAGQDLFWIGATNVELQPQETIIYRMKWTVSPRNNRETEASVIEGKPETLLNAIHPSKPLPLLPKPKQVQNGGGYLPLNSEIEFTSPLTTEETEAFGKEFLDLLDRRWDRSSYDARNGKTNIQFRTGSLGLKPEGYKLEVTSQGVTIIGQDKEGIRHGLRTLASLVRARNGDLEIPQTTITDYPSLTWRGIHMFVGPKALDFQTKLLEDVLAPMKLNKVVLQCERTNWLAIKGTETAITMDKADLKELTNRYKAHGFEPIPLIQSLGHAEWMFANRQNLDIAVNPDIPYTMDPRKAKTREVLTDLWTEVCETMNPKTVHFGMDEIDMRGLPDDPSFTTRLWTRHVPFLNDLANKLNVTPMMWGDIMLHTSEAPDAAHAKTLQTAKERRRVLKRGTLIADWHYKADPKPETFKSLNLWKREGMKPIASTWYRPENIYGFAHAAIQADAGLLQTTWAGYESTEDNMIRQFDQLAAYVLAADYAWSGRKELPDKLPYDPAEVVQQMYFARPQVVKPVSGYSIDLNRQRRPENLQIGPYTVRISNPVQLAGVTDARAFQAPRSVTVNVNHQAKSIVFGLDSLARLKDVELAATVTVTLADGTTITRPLQYGSHVRAMSDQHSSTISPRADGISAYYLNLADSPVTVKSITIKVENRAAGLRLHGITLL